jgi:CO/xanthine dehydrogenase Mo-binding subunit
MTHIRKRMPSVSRRGFVIGSAAAVGGLSFGFHVPGASATVAAPEINAWVLIKADETVVIRIARSEMGQGTLTGLAQLVVQGHHGVSDPEPESRAQPRVGQLLDRWQSRHPRVRGLCPPWRRDGA